MGYLPAQVRSMPWHDERLILEGMAEEDLIELPSSPTESLETLAATGVTVRSVG